MTTEIAKATKTLYQCEADQRRWRLEDLVALEGEALADAQAMYEGGVLPSGVCPGDFIGEDAEPGQDRCAAFCFALQVPDDEEPAKPPVEIKCPKCGNTDTETRGVRIAYVEDASRDWSILSTDDGVLSLGDDEFNDETAGGRLHCMKCGHEFPVPESLEVSFE